MANKAAYPWNYRKNVNKQFFDSYQYSQSIFETGLHPGRWNKSISVLNTTTDFTGSNFGAAAIVVTATGTNATASLSAGGTIDIGVLPTGIHEFSVSQVESNDATNTVYVLIQVPNNRLGQ